MAYDFSLLLDGHCASDVPSYLKTCADEHRYEVVGLVSQDGLIELDDHGDGVEYSPNDGERKVWVIEPYTVWI
jgi:hypothetical protein